MPSNIPWCPLSLSSWVPQFNTCVIAHNHHLILRNCLSGSEVIPDMSWLPANQTLTEGASKSTQLTRNLSGHLILIHRSGIHNFFDFKTSKYSDIDIIWCLCILSSSVWVPILMSAPLWTARPIAGLLSDGIIHIQILWVLFLIHNTFGKLYHLLWQPCSTFELVLITPKNLWYMFLRCLDGLNQCLN